MTMYMPEDQSRTGLHTIDGQNIALQSVNVEVAFSNLFCDTIMTQAYRNLENTPIEAVYTFPLTSRAVLLGMDVMIGGRKLQGVVVERSSAEEQYEEAIINGDAAIMLEQIQPGLYTMNVGNIGAARRCGYKSATPNCMPGKATAYAFICQPPLPRVTAILKRPGCSPTRFRTRSGRCMTATPCMLSPFSAKNPLDQSLLP
ncbi:MAG: VIT domain-containing protein [Desulfoprunum sp.]